MGLSASCLKRLHLNKRIMFYRMLLLKAINILDYRIPSQYVGRFFGCAAFYCWMSLSIALVNRYKQEIAANCEKNIRAKDTQVSLMIFSSEFKLVKPFVFLSFIFESTDRYNVFHMTHT